MKVRPILFTDPMVQAILGGAKTQTRRVVKPIPQMVTDKSIVTWEGDAGALMHLFDQVGRHCPYGQSGDRLWVREAFFDTTPYANAPLFQGRTHPIAYRADGEVIGCHRWRPSIHMPRTASRILLEITAVRVERLQDCSENDAQAEGIQRFDDFFAAERLSANEFRHMAPTAVESYALLWNAINGPGSWLANPWVWVIEFKRVEVE